MTALIKTANGDTIYDGPLTGFMYEDWISEVTLPGFVAPENRGSHHCLAALPQEQAFPKFWTCPRCGIGWKFRKPS